MAAASAIEEDVRGPKDYLAVVGRRKWRFIVPLVVIFAICLAVAFVIPPTFRSTGTVLIEEPEVPREFIQSTITSFAAQRLQVIEQRVMTTQNLITIINKFNLFREERRTTPINEVASDFRDRFSMDLVSAEVVDPRSGRSMQATIAFNVSYEDPNPRVAQQVANELVSLYLNENLRDRRLKAAETTGFLADEGRRLGELVSEMERRLAEFKRQYSGQLPEQMGLNLQLIRRTEGELGKAQERLHALEERKILLQSELAQISPHSARVVDGQTVLSPPERLKALQTRYISMRGIYGENHPDVAKMRREISVLKKETGGGTDVEALKSQLSALKAELETTRKKYGPQHPDVKSLERQARSLETAVKENRGRKRNGALNPKPDNPPYVFTQSQLKTVELEMPVVKTQIEQLKAALQEYEERVFRTPEIERQYLILKRDYDNAYIKYKDVKAKQLEAQLAQSLETERKSERFSLIEPPAVPIEPIRPNRLAIIFIGFIFAVTAGIGNVFLAESMDETVYGTRQLASVVGHQPLAAIPLVKDMRSKKRRKRWAFFLVLLVALAFGAFVAIFHYYVTPLDVFWFSTLRDFGIS
ncbi:MAG: lipopolysaccharide biosynthesis protein [Alphaproteobacteria bacterium]|nr:lipopolysaccharide biosynthesis protein [Alphaproteobacteria bacterium]